MLGAPKGFTGTLKISETKNKPTYYQQKNVWA
jgi:hypothetical protein